MNNVHIAALLCTIVSIILLMVALRTRHWVDLGQSYSGLWEVCFSTLIGTSCITYGNDISDHIHATRAFLCFGVIATSVAFFALCAIFFRSYIASFQLAKVAAIANCISALFALIALATFTGVEVPNNFFGWSFGVGWATIPLCLISGVLSYLIA